MAIWAALLAAGCGGGKAVVDVSESADTADTGDTSSLQDTAEDTGEEGADDPDLISSTHPLAQVFDKTALKNLCGGLYSTDTAEIALCDEFKAAIDDIGASVVDGLTTPENENRYGNYSITVFGDSASFTDDFGGIINSQYLAVTGGSSSLTEAPSGDLMIQGSGYYIPSCDLDISDDYAVVAVNQYINADGSTGSIGFCATPFGSDPVYSAATNVDGIVYPSKEEQVNVTIDQVDSPEFFYASEELTGAESAMESLYDYMSYLFEQVSITGGEIF